MVSTVLLVILIMGIIMLVTRRSKRSLRTLKDSDLSYFSTAYKYEDSIQDQWFRKGESAGNYDFVRRRS